MWVSCGRSCFKSRDGKASRSRFWGQLGESVIPSKRRILMRVALEITHFGRGALGFWMSARTQIGCGGTHGARVGASTLPSGVRVGCAGRCHGRKREVLQHSLPL